MHFNPTAVTLSCDAVCACKPLPSPSSLRIRNIPCVWNFTQQTQLKSGVSQSCELSTMCSLFKDIAELGMKWATDGPPFFLDFQSGCMVIYPKASHSRSEFAVSSKPPRNWQRSRAFLKFSAAQKNLLVACRSRIVHGTCSDLDLQLATCAWSEWSGRKVNNWSGCTNAAFLFLQNGFLSICPTLLFHLHKNLITTQYLCSLHGSSLSAFWQ